MSAVWYKEQPTNRNFLNPIGYLLKLEKFEGVDFFCQTANVPDVAMPVTEVASPFRNLPIIPHPSHRLFSKGSPKKRFQLSAHR